MQIYNIKISLLEDLRDPSCPAPSPPSVSPGPTPSSILSSVPSALAGSAMSASREDSSGTSRLAGCVPSPATDSPPAAPGLAPAPAPHQERQT